MKRLIRHIFIWLFLFYGIGANASHILGGDITYKFIRGNQYKVTLNIYRDCNGCKINGKGGGSSLDDCSEIDYLYVKGVDNSGSKETKFSLSRESITDITPICKAKISACQKNSNSIFGIELQQFTTIIDLDNSKIKGFCDYYVYITLAERNADITTGQASQNFCVDAYIKTCLNSDNNSPDFSTAPDFIVNSNKTQYNSFHSIDIDNDSLVYKLIPALSDIDKEVNYNIGFTYLNPLTPYCVDYPCKPDKTTTPPLGFYLDGKTGEVIYMPVTDGERAVVAVKIEKHRKISGQWELIGYIKRDIQVYIQTGTGNNSPKFTGSDHYEICEEEPFELKIEAIDDKNSLTMVQDTVSFSFKSPVADASFSQVTQSAAPYYYGLLKWKPAVGTSNFGIFNFSVSVRDNSCPLNAISSKVISIKVLPKEHLSINFSDLGCGNYEIKTSPINPGSKILVQVMSEDGSKEIFRTDQKLDTISFLPKGTYILRGLLISVKGCATQFIDTIKNNPSSPSTLSGDSSVCPMTNYDYLIMNSFNRKATIEWYFDSNLLTGKSTSINTSFSKNGILQANLTYQKGKWYCLNTLKKQITLIKLTDITGDDEIKVCHNTGNFNLNTVNISPPNGVWSSSSQLVSNGFVNTSGASDFYDDTISLLYEINFGCKVTKSISLILGAIPPFELSSISICEMKTPVRLEQLIIKPYNVLDYTYTWGLTLNPQNIKYDQGHAVIYPSDFGFGKYQYFGEAMGKNGCKSFDTALIEITPAVKISFDNMVNLCQGASIADIDIISGVMPKGGTWSFYDFELFKDKHFVLSDSCGTFEVSYTYDNYGCYDSKKMSITIQCKPPMSLINIPSKVCDSELPLSLYASPAGGIWEGAYINGSLFSPPVNQSLKEYSIAYKISRGQCDFKKETKIKVAPSPQILISPGRPDYCDKEDVFFNGSIQHTNLLNIKYFGGAKSFSSAGSQTFTDEFIFNGTFDKNALAPKQSIYINAINDDGCSSSKEYFINVFEQPKISKLRDTMLCEDSDFKLNPNITYGGKEPLSFKWMDNFIDVGSDLSFESNKLSAGKHQLSFSAGNNYCSDSKTVTLIINPKPKIDFLIQPSDVASVLQPEFQFVNRSEPNLTWLWNFGTIPVSSSSEPNPKYSYSDTGSYKVTLMGTNVFGCSDYITKTLFVKPDILVFIPNAFTPNNKDVEANNVFSVSVDNYQSFNIEIYDRWGHKVYQSSNPSETWDGKSGEVFCTPDVYFYTVKVNSYTGHWYQYKGTITLIK